MILDTNAISALFEGSPELAEILENGPDRLSIPVVVIGEYRYGLLRSRFRRQLEPLLETLIANSELLTVDAGTAVIYASVRDELRAVGHPIPENDVWIAAVARQHALPIVSLDRHFDPVPGVERISWGSGLG